MKKNSTQSMQIYLEYSDQNRLKKWEKITSYKNKNYAKNSYVPLGSPTSLTSDEFDNVVFNSKNEWNYNNISLLNFSGSHIAELLSIAQNIDSGVELDLNHYKKNLKKLVEKYLSKISFLKEPDSVVFNTTNDNSPTVTWDFRENNKPGLHIDSWELEPVSERKKSSNRICLNLGPSDRYFVFFNLGIDAIKTNYKLDGEDVNEIVSKFLEQCDIPLLGILLKPGDAYIAPTEYIIHDGHIPCGTMNSTLTLRGEIQVDKYIE